MTPLSNILTDRAETFSLSETLTRIEHDSHESIRAAQHTMQVPPEEQTPTIELSQIKQALLDMRAQIDIIVSALDADMHVVPAPPAPTPTPLVEAYLPSTPAPQIQERPQYIPEPPAPVHSEQPLYVERDRASAPVYGSFRIVEGVFNGQRMIGEDGNHYDVPQNYASKSKMVEGDHLKLTITAEGKQYYKQVGPVKRKSLMGELMQDPQGNWVVVVDRIPYKVLTASVTFYKARPGTKTVILVPEEGIANWGAVDSFLS
ncbi:MAG: hypothetical protein CO030_04930 [Candidatus Magasanikbacteria bacterium CG_4_9_14_0_2_um_filter_42_11]|uniref:50S ribosomal protein L7/L12 n=1 Tax=Candidatus Magasanikbacteria bacterium CG_4_9_14_0_2_um_filter_42_11 TaxID=1974643 RepID=A0A2M8F8K9_9BACT|nr:MAG: hypothetical protein COY70_00520 [Candidatus Magasanikbacteria bacterium CG_4_10_14_0_8_um_filter_42_12]PJC52036.1 MAG: hypothetical protein CO030_04930 [Candidatus Magasanikbacteria bacterium CG_4_9_14_0_2_um_filter_42_11]